MYSMLDQKTLTVTCSSSTIETLEKGVFIVVFEQVNVSWEPQNIEIVIDCYYSIKFLLLKLMK